MPLLIADWPVLRYLLIGIAAILHITPHYTHYIITAVATAIKAPLRFDRSAIDITPCQPLCQ